MSAYKRGSGRGAEAKRNGIGYLIVERNQAGMIQCNIAHNSEDPVPIPIVFEVVVSLVLLLENRKEGVGPLLDSTLLRWVATRSSLGNVCQDTLEGL